MDQYDYLIIGGGITGVTAAETIREEDSAATIGIISDEPHVLYSRVLLPAYLKKQILREKLFLRTANHFDEKQIDLRREESVIGVDPEAGDVVLANHVRLRYGKLLVVSGGRVKTWSTSQIEEGVYRLQTLDDADRLFANLSRIHAPLVLGSSFIGLEFLEIFLTHQIKPSVLTRDAHFFGSMIDGVGGTLLAEHFARHGITVYAEDTVVSSRQHEGVYEVATAQEKKISCDMFAVGIGLERNIDFLRGVNILLGENGVRVNEFLETSQTNIWAAGDVAEFYDLIAGKYRLVGNWTNAFLQGKRAGLNMVGKREAFQNVSGYSIANLGLQITALGDVSDDRDTVARTSRKLKPFSYERFFFREGMMVGAFLINRFSDKTYLAKLIETHTPVEKYRNMFQDPAFDIHEISMIG